MGKGSGSAPSAPDPQELTQAQSKANIDAILASQFVNSTPTFTPFGSQQFYVSPTGQYSQVQAPSQPELERLASGYALGNTVLNRALTGVDQIRPLDFSTAPSAVTSLDLSRLPGVMSADQFAGERRRIEDSIYGRQAEMLRDDFNRRDERLENRLVNQGLRLGSEGYGEARRQLGETENQAYADARTRAIQFGGDEFARAFGMSLQGRQQGFGEQKTQASLANQARAAAIQEQLLGRQVPLQELQTYAGFAPGLGMQQFLGTPNYQVAPADVTGATNNQFNAQMNAYNQAQQRQSSNIGALAGVGGAIAGALPWATWLSDRDSKRDVQPVNAEAVLDMVRMMPTSEWSYKPEAQAMGQPGGRHIGPMAQDFRRITGKGDGRSIPVVDAFGMLLTATKALADKVERVA
jgi:hypothetical protein